MGKFVYHTSVRVGWELKAFNTFFDYWKGTIKPMRKAGKVLAGWCNGDKDSKHTSGSPPSLDDIVTAKGKVLSFVKCLLEDHKHLKAGIKEMLVANLMRFWNEFIEILSLDPKKQYQNTRKHGFVNNVRYICNICDFFYIKTC